MSIEKAFDDTEAIFNPGDVYADRGDIEKIADKCIITFSCKVLSEMQRRFTLKKETCISAACGVLDIFSFVYEGEKILFLMSFISAPLAAMAVEEVSYVTKATKFIVFGSCGVLDSSITRNKIIVPTEAYRDEGLSYHYVEASDYIKISNAS